MKVINRKEFLKMPKNTLFSEYSEDGTIGVLSTKYDSYPNDYLESYTTWLEAKDMGESAEADERLFKGESVKCDMISCGRNGMFEDSQRYLIYEMADLLQLQLLVENALKNG
jgi:hypothetical protein